MTLSAITPALLVLLNVLYYIGRILSVPIYLLDFLGILRPVGRLVFIVYDVIYTIVGIIHHVLCSTLRATYHIAYSLLVHHLTFTMSVALITNTLSFCLDYIEDNNIWLSIILGYFLTIRLGLRFLHFFLHLFNLVVLIAGIFLWVSWKMENKILIDHILNFGATATGFTMSFMKNLVVLFIQEPGRIGGFSDIFELLWDSVKLAWR